MSGGRGVVLTIDGPAGSGKSTIARAVAAALDLPHVDTGAYYRAAALAVLRAGVDAADAAACTAVAQRVTIERRNGRTILDGDDVEAEIRGPDVTAVVSRVAGHRPLRALMVERQRAAAAPGGAVVEGRDAGTVVFPDAPFKVWLTASPEERARRRAAQLGIDGAADVAALAATIARRDADDRDRMDVADDAVVVDTTGRTIDEVVTDLTLRAGAVTE